MEYWICRALGAMGKIEIVQDETNYREMTVRCKK